MNMNVYHIFTAKILELFQMANCPQTLSLQIKASLFSFFFNFQKLIYEMREISALR